MGTAPHMAMSFTVPWMAREPMSPPGKKRGLITKESVEKARRPASTPNTAPSLSCSKLALSKAGTNIFSISIWLMRPPPPWAMSTWG